MSLIRHLLVHLLFTNHSPYVNNNNNNTIKVPYPDFKVELVKIDKECVIPAKLNILQGNEEWVINKYSVIAEEYVKRTKLLLSTFQSLYYSPILMKAEEMNDTNMSTS